MGWIIFGVIALCITLFLWKNSYTDRIRNRDNLPPHEYYYHYDESDKFKMPIWLLAIFIVGFLTPILNILFAIGVVVLFLVGRLNDLTYIHFSDNHIFGKIGKWLNKDLFN